jgi:hypothetical protein
VSDRTDGVAPAPRGRGGTPQPLRAALAGVLLFAIGLALGAGLFFLHQRESERLGTWERADGRITDVLPSASGDRVLQRTAFTTADGDRISFTVALSRRLAGTVNDTVPVLYPPDDPRQAVIDHPGRRRLRNIVGGAAALTLVFLGGYVAWYASRRVRMSPPRT